MMKKVYHIDKPTDPVEMYEIDAKAAVQNFPKEWAEKPWTASKEKAEPVPTKKYEAKHRGGGSYSVMGADGKEVLDKLTKDDAELFNTSSEETQESFIEAEKAKRG